MVRVPEFKPARAALPQIHSADSMAQWDGWRGNGAYKLPWRCVHRNCGRMHYPMPGMVNGFGPELVAERQCRSHEDAPPVGGFLGGFRASAPCLLRGEELLISAPAHGWPTTGDAARAVVCAEHRDEVLVQFKSWMCGRRVQLNCQLIGDDVDFICGTVNKCPQVRGRARALLLSTHTAVSASLSRRYG